MSGNKQSTKAGGGNDIVEALLEVFAKAEQLGPSVPAPLRDAIASLREALPDLSDDRAIPARQALADGLSARRDQRGQRHDGKRPPAGYTFEHGYLIRQGRDATCGPQSPRDVSLLTNIRGTVQLWQAEQATGHLWQHRAKLEAAYEAIYGYPFGEAWRQALVELLEQDRTNREEQRLQGHQGPLPPGPLREFRDAMEATPGGAGLFKPFDGDEILRRLQERGCPPPADLTPEIVDGMRKMVGSRGGKTAKSVVAEFLKSRRGNS